MKKRAISFFCGLLVLFTTVCSVSAVSDRAYGFYCIRNKEHKQPRLDQNICFIENYDCYYLDRAHNENNGDKVIYLTFDAGYENGNIEKTLDVLKEENVKGAFFILENLLNKEPDLVKRMVNEGHTVGNHTAKHHDMTRIDTLEEFRAELDTLNSLYYVVTGKEMERYYRPPEGRFDERSLSFAKDLGYKTIFWSFAYADWDNDKQPTEEYARNKIMENIHNGAVLLLHPTSETNARILGDVIRELKAEGYRFGELSELVGV